jgi:hypothetical protein
MMAPSVPAVKNKRKARERDGVETVAGTGRMKCPLARRGAWRGID